MICTEWSRIVWPNSHTISRLTKY